MADNSAPLDDKKSTASELTARDADYHARPALVLPVRRAQALALLFQRVAVGFAVPIGLDGLLQLAVGADPRIAERVNLARDG
ncbi:hypothetical protein GY26_11320 [Gammaproteobacteria bacterium MFB021]|nr:hypothetical protein GY26_11320 [Gammaproteobacteria bacterium MFB021]